MSNNKTAFGLSENIAGLVSYAGVWVTGIIIYVTEKENKTVRFHALQSLIWFGALSIITCLVSFFIGWIPLIGWIATTALGLLSFASWLFLMFTAYKGQQFRIPILGDIVWDTINK